MTMEAELSDGRFLEFPDGTDPAVIQSTVKRLLDVSQQAQDPPLVQRLDTAQPEAPQRDVIRDGPINAQDILSLSQRGKITNELARLSIDAINKGQQLTIVDGDIRRIEGADKRFEKLPTPGGIIGSLAAGAELGFKEIGAGALQLAGRVGELFEVEGAARLQERATTVFNNETQRFEAVTAGSPVSGAVGRIGGQLAALPLGGATVPKAIAAGVTAGALQPTTSGGLEGDIQRITSATIGGVAGGVFQKAIPAAVSLVGSGFNKAAAVTKSAFEAATGRSVPPSAFTPEGIPTPEFIKSLKDAGISMDDLNAMLSGVDDQSAKSIAALEGGFQTATREGLDPAQAARLSEFEALDIPATTGQITRAFETQQAEDVAKSAIGEVGTEARAFFTQQQVRLVDASKRFSKSIGAVEGAGIQERGELIKTALLNAKNENKAGVTALYDKAKRLAGEETTIPPEKLEDVLSTALDELPVEDSVAKSIEKAFAKFGVIQGDLQTSGINTILTRSDGSRVVFKGSQEQLTLGNAEKLRQRLNGIFPNDRSGVVVSAKNALDNIVDETLDDIIRKSQPKGDDASAFAVTPGEVRAQQATVEARKGFRQFKETFDAADIVGQITGTKRDRTTPLIDSSLVVDKILKSSNKIENVQRIKKALSFSKVNKEESEAAIRELQRGFVDDIFNKSISETPDGFFISGNKLNSSLSRMGNDLIKELFTKEQISGLRSLQRVVGNATIPIPRTTNPSGTGSRLLNAIIGTSKAVEGIPGVNQVGRFGFSAIQRTIKKTIAEEQEEAALAGIRAARPEGVTNSESLIDERALARFIGLYATPTLRQTAIEEFKEEVK